MMGSTLRHSVFDDAEGGSVGRDVPVPSSRRLRTGETVPGISRAAVESLRQGLFMATLTALVFWAVIALVVLFVAI